MTGHGIEFAEWLLRLRGKLRPHEAASTLEFAVVTDETPPTELVADKYQLTRLLGRGGMGSVWEGVHASLGTRVAVKFIEAEHAASSEARQRFINEAHAAARLNSKHVVQVYDHGVGADGRPYIVMEFLDGEPLDARLDRERVLAPEQVISVVSQVSRALTRAHEQGIVHRDLKPENVFLVWDAEDQRDLVKVVDFGIAKFLDKGAQASSSTRTGSVLGTPYYMSPEQARGLRTVDQRSDLWSLGVIVYRCVVGELPFVGEAVGDLLVKICTIDPPPPSSVNPTLPRGFDDWVARALNREPDARFQSAVELVAALAAAFGVAPITSSGEGAMIRLSNPSLPDTSAGFPAQTVTEFTQNSTAESRPKKSPALWVAGGAALLTVAAIGAFAMSRTGAARSEPAIDPLGGAAPATSVADPATSAAPTPSVAEAPAADAAGGSSAPPASVAAAPSVAPHTPSKPVAAATAKPVRNPTPKATSTPPKPDTTPKVKPPPASTGRDIGY